MSSPTSNPISAAQSALEALIHGLRTGQWQAFRDRLTEEVTIWFPKAPLQGLNRGQDQTIALLQSIPWDAATAITVEQVTCNGTTVMLELRLDRPPGKLLGFERAAIAFQLKGNKISEIQPYLLLFHPAQP